MSNLKQGTSEKHKKLVLKYEILFTGTQFLVTLDPHFS